MPLPTRKPDYLRLGAGARLGRLLPAAIAALLLSGPAQYALAGEITHVVGKGQTLGKIAKRYHVSVEVIREVNNLKPGQRIHPGLALSIPEKGKEAEALKKAQQARKSAEELGKGKKEPGKGGKGKKGEDKAKKDGGEDKGDGPLAKAPRRPGFVRMTRGSEKLETQLLNRRGKLAPAALTGLSKMLRFAPTGEKIPIDPRLASMIGMVSDHFGGRPLKVVSGYRPYSPAQYTPHSNHNLGRAVDFAVEGVPNTVLRDFCRTFRNAGVGFYPNSSFVHLDTRTGKAFWVDYSHPGEAPHYDSPGAAGGGDEPSAEVEPHGGAIEGAQGPADAEAGSAKTQDRPTEPIEKKSGNSNAPDGAPVEQPGVGQK
jgi:uncharacterized protein YcbK (DUF882 family)